jgi:hypothetical protein
MSETYNCWNMQKPYLQKEGGSREKPKSFYAFIRKQFLPHL